MALKDVEDELATPPFPTAVNYLWKIYLRIRNRKSSGFAGPNKIEWPDIQAFVSLTRTRLAPWEVAIIEKLDDVYLVAMSEAREGTDAENAAAARDALAQAGKQRGGQ